MLPPAAIASLSDPLDSRLDSSPAQSATVFSSMLRARFENQNSRPLWNSSEAKIATSTVGTAAIAVNKRDQAHVKSAAAEPALLRAPHRDLARIERHERDCRQEDRDQQAARSAAETARFQARLPGSAASTLSAEHANEHKREQRPSSGRRTARSPAPAGASFPAANVTGNSAVRASIRGGPSTTVAETTHFCARVSRQAAERASHGE